MLSGSQSAHFLRFASSTTRVGLGLDWPMPGRRFPPPWTAEEYRGISYIVRHVNNFPVAYTYLESESGRRGRRRVPQPVDPARRNEKPGRTGGRPG
jgi:hypothetical protein